MDGVMKPYERICWSIGLPVTECRFLELKVTVREPVLRSRYCQGFVGDLLSSEEWGVTYANDISRRSN